MLERVYSEVSHQLLQNVSDHQNEKQVYTIETKKQGFFPSVNELLEISGMEAKITELLKEKEIDYQELFEGDQAVKRLPDFTSYPSQNIQAYSYGQFMGDPSQKYDVDTAVSVYTKGIYRDHNSEGPHDFKQKWIDQGYIRVEAIDTPILGHGSLNVNRHRSWKFNQELASNNKSEEEAELFRQYVIASASVQDVLARYE